MKILVKNTVAVILLFIFLLGAFSGVLLPVANAIKESDTPIARIADDAYSYSNNDGYFDRFRSEIEAMGGYIYNEDEYNKKYAPTTSLDYEYKFEPIKQVITVMTTATGSTKNGNYVPSKPLANAIVRLNGVPRYTDKNGQVRATLDREYVELFVEKNGYGPYIEIMEVTGEEKTVYLKKESDDIDIYGVMLTDIEYNPVNLVNSEYTIFPEALDAYIANMQFLVNVKADRYMLLLDSEVIYSSAENVIYDIDFTDDMEGKKFYAQVEYQDILSEPVLLNLSISIPEIYKNSESNEDNTRNADFSKLNPFEGENTYGFLGDINIDIAELLKINDLISKKNSDLDLKFFVDRRKGTIGITLGFEYTEYIDKTKRSDGKSDDEELRDAVDQINKFNEDEEQANIERAHTQELLNKADKELQDYEKGTLKEETKKENLERDRDNYQTQLDNMNNEKKGKVREVKDSLNKANYQIEKAQKTIEERDKKTKDLIRKRDEKQASLDKIDQEIASIPGLVRDYKNSFKQFQKGFSFGIEIIASLEYSYKEQKLADIALSIGGTLGYKVNGQTFVGYIPIYYSLNVKAGLEAKLEFHSLNNGWIDFKKFWEYILLKGHAGFEGELGVGINHFLNVGFFLDADYGISGYVFAKGFKEHALENLGSEFEWELGLRATVFLFADIEIGVGGYSVNEYASLEEIYARNEMALSLAMLQDWNSISSNIYDGSKPQIEKIGDDYSASWIDLEYNGNEPRTVLKYSIYRNGVWSAPKSVLGSGSDFYQDMYYDGQDLHITWQNIKEGTDITSLEQMSKNSEIYYAKFNPEKSEFTDIKQITTNDTLDLGPKFALQESSDQPLAIVWQRNSENDLIGLTGRNSIVYSVEDGGNWSALKSLYESDNYFSFVDSSYVDGRLTSAFVEDMDNDLTTDDRKIVVCADGLQRRIIGEEFEVVNNPQFFKLNGNPKLTFYADGNVRYTDDFVAIDKLDVSDGKINDTYKIVDNDTTMYVYYYKLSADNSAQAFVSIYDKATGSWQTDVCLTSAENKVTCPSIAILPSGDILTVYNSLNKETEIVSLEYEIKQLRKDFEISYAFYDLDVSRGEKFDLFMIVKNTGDYPLRSLDISAFGINDTIVLEKAIEIGETDTVKVERIFDISAEGKEIITMRLDDIVRQYTLTTRFTDISIDGVKKIDSFRESYDLKLTNSSDEGSKIYLDVYYNGKIIDTKETFMHGNSELKYTYANDEFENGGYVYFEIRTEMEDKYQSDNSISFFIEYMAEKENVKVNPYFESMQIAKSL
ncbi:MAG: hypothetical protein HDT32_06675 [Clostridiales bacterium]|nr:hypothetical protein [Clostridiales bacterium]